MPRRRRLIAVLVLAAALVAPGAAHAGVFPGEVIDGPTADLVSVGDVGLARDGSGAVVYVKRDGGVEHVFVSRLADGAWQPPERVDAGLPDAGVQPVVAASDGGRLAIAFLSGGSLYAVVRPAGAQGPLPAPQRIDAATSSPSIDMSINGAGYVTYTYNGDVRAARLDRTSTSFVGIGVPLDLDANQPAGDTPSRRSDVAVSADGTGLAVWGERGSDGRDHVWARRLYGATISTAPQDLTLGDFQGHTAGDAGFPDVDIEDDSSFAWVSFRQTLDGQPRGIARRLVGSAFGDPALTDPLPFPTPEGVGSPSIDINGTGGGLVAEGSTGSHQVYLAPLADDTFGQGAPRADSAPSNTVDPRPVVGVAQSGAGFVAWLQSTGDNDPVAVHGRLYDVKAGLESEANLSNLDFGAVDTDAGYDAAADRVNDAAIVAIQGSGANRRLTAAMIDRPPGAFVGTTTQKVRRLSQLNWGTSFDLWGPVTYGVQVDGQQIGTTTNTKYVPDQRIPDGLHRWRVVATDRRGQPTATSTRQLRIDNTPPALAIRVSGTRRAGRLLKFRFTTGDVPNPGAAGLARIRVQWGDGSRPALTGKNVAHRYPRGRFTLRVTSVDKAGNFTVVTRRLVIKKRK